jgi:hypothetical protein
MWFCKDSVEVKLEVLPVNPTDATNGPISVDDTVAVAVAVFIVDNCFFISG